MQYSEEEVFDYLDALRDSGETNMFGATAYLMRDLYMNRHEAREWLMKWMRVKQQEAQLSNYINGR